VSAKVFMSLETSSLLHSCCKEANVVNSPSWPHAESLIWVRSMLNPNELSVTALFLWLL